MRITTFVMCTALLCGGCMVGPNYEPPAVQVADHWLEIDDPRIKGEPADHSAWWTVFNDPVLDQLIHMAYEQNLTLRSAGIRIASARYQKAVVEQNLTPAYEASGSYTRTQVSANGNPGGLPSDPSQRRVRSVEIPQQFYTAQAILLPTVSHIQSALPNQHNDRRFDFWQLGFDMTWELDVWGRFRRTVESADATLDASIRDYDDVLVTLLAEVASTYIDIRTLQRRISVNQSNSAKQRQALDVAEALLSRAAVTKLDVLEAKSLLFETESQLPNLQNQLRASQNGLCVLLGRPPHDIDELLGGEQPIPNAPSEVVVGVPADLLRRRPDVQQAERQVAAQSANVGVAISDVYPHLSLNGAVSLGANHSFSDLFEGKSYGFDFGPSFTWDIFNTGILINNIRIEDAEFQALAVDYQNTVIQAAEEAESAINSFLRGQEQSQRLEDSAQYTVSAVDVAVEQYGAGTAPYSRVYTTQNALLKRQDNLAITQGQIATNLVATYKALGGGWQIREGQPFIPQHIAEDMAERTAWKTVLTPWQDEDHGGRVDVEEGPPLPAGIRRVRPEAYQRPEELGPTESVAVEGDPQQPPHGHHEPQ